MELRPTRQARTTADTHDSVDGLAVAAFAVTVSKKQQELIESLAARIEQLESMV